MKVLNITTDQLNNALSKVNNEHGYHLEFNRQPEQIGSWLHFTIKSVKSGIPGARTSSSGRNMPSASWHAHGYLFDEILSIEPDAVIETMQSTIYMDNDGETIGNWVDSNVGSRVQPCMYSETSIL